VPSDDRPDRPADRCSEHPSRAAVARCDVCSRAMCLACAIPVRGGTVGTECLAVALGPDVVIPAPAPRDRGGVVRGWQRLCSAIAVVATLLPWSRFGAGSEPFGAWSDSFRWSMVAAVAAVAALVVCLGRDVRRPVGAAWDVALATIAVVVVVASVLAIARPPAFTSPWLGPWVAAGGGATVLLANAFRRWGAAARNL
jgi:hypothetical protein